MGGVIIPLLNPYYQFGPFRFDPDDGLLYRGDQIAPLPPKALETLRCLLERHGGLVAKDELIKAVWPDSFVEEGALTQNIFRLRKALDGFAGIETVPRRGYRFVGKIEVCTRGASSTSRPLRRTVLVGGVAAAALVGAGAVLGRRTSAYGPALEDIRRLTRSGNVLQCAISPDERLVGYVLRENEGSSLWVAQVAGGAGWRALGPVTGRWDGLRFAPNGSRIYFVLNNTLESVAPSGAERRKLLDDVDEAPAVSPAGDRIAFVREDLHRAETAVIVSAPDGSNSRQVAAQKLPWFYQRIAWRPDGKALVASFGKVADTRDLALVELNLEDGAQRPVGRQRWQTITGIGFSSAADRLYVSGADRRWSAGQLWRVGYPDGKALRITRDAVHYAGVSLSRAGMLATTGGSSVSSLAILKGPEPGGLSGLPETGQSERSPAGLGPDSIVYEALGAEAPQIWIMRRDGGERRQLTRGDSAAMSPAVASNTLLVVFVSQGASGSGLWSMDRNGADLRPVCSGVGLESPACTPDGKWVFFTSTSDGRPSLWKVAREQGEPVQLTQHLSRMPAVSPDGRQVAFYYWSERSDEPRRIVSLPVGGGAMAPLMNLEDADVLKCLRWEPGGRALYLLLRRNGVADIWRLRLPGGGLIRLSSFQDDRTLSFDSLDPSHIVCARAEGWSDVLLVRTGRS